MAAMLISPSTVQRYRPTRKPQLCSSCDQHRRWHLGGTASTGFTLLKTDLPYTINGTLTNSSDIPIVVTYTVTPKYNGCNDGPPQFITVTVEPTPQATIVTTTPVICDGGNVDITINSPTVPTQPGNLSYVVAVTSTDAGSLGGTASTGFTVIKTDLPYTISEPLPTAVMFR